MLTMLKIYVFPPTMTVRLMRPWATSGQFGGTAWVGAPRAVLRGWANIAATYYIPSTHRRFCFRIRAANGHYRHGTDILDACVRSNGHVRTRACTPQTRARTDTAALACPRADTDTSRTLATRGRAMQWQSGHAFDSLMPVVPSSALWGRVRPRHNA